MDQRFRPDVEGMRGIAVLAVILFHGFPSAVPGGFAGVDVFFVVSGFVITRLLLHEAGQTGQIDLLQFWSRRIRRILPLATLVICAIQALALLVHTLDSRDLGRHLIAAALFFYNYRQAGKSDDYLDNDHSQNPVLHYWSLSVEEQFYIVWPVLCASALAYLAQRDSARFRRQLLQISAGLWALSLAYGCYLTLTAPAFAFYDTAGRAWQLLTGAILAMIEPRTGASRSPFHGWLAGLAAVVLAAAFVVPLGKFHYPGVAALIPVLGAAIVIHYAAAPQNPANRVLSLAPLRYVGRISFGLYLWHWPLLIFAGLLFGKNNYQTLLVLLLAVSIASFTHHFFEQPIRHSQDLKRSLTRSFGTGAAMLAFGAGSSLLLRQFGPDQVPVAPNVYLSAQAIKKDRPSIYTNGCLVRFDGTVSPPCEFGNTRSKRTVVLLGDSHAGNWFAPLEHAAIEEGWRMVVRIKASCRPIDTPQTRVDGPARPYPECDAWLQTSLNEIERLKPALVIVGGTQHDLPIEAELSVIRRLAGIAPTVLMRDTAWYPESSANCLRRTQNPAACQWPLAQLANNASYPRSGADQHGPNVETLDLNLRVCPLGVCSAVSGTTVVMYDSHHFTNSFALTLADEFKSLLKRHAR